MEPITEAQPHRNPAGGTLVPVPKTETVIFSVRMPKALHERLRKLSEADYSTVNRSIVVAVERYVHQMASRRPKDLGDDR